MVSLLAEMTEAPPRLEPGAVLGGRFAIERLLGRGGMGEVYAAWDQELAAPVAVKVIRRDVAADAGQIARLRREVVTARQVSHRNVCRLHDVGVDTPGDPFITMELLEGETLAEHLRREGAVYGGEARQWIAEIAAGLDAAHAAGVIHRDLKPGNVMLVHRGTGRRAVITDFGLARMVLPSPEAGNSRTRAMGTLAYMAPEQLRGETPTAASDIYAMGLIARELGGGDAPADWKRMVEACLAHEAERRPATAGSAVKMLARAAGRGPGRVVRTAAVAVLGLLALAAAVFRYRQVSPQIQPGEELLLTPVVNATLDPQLDAATTVLAQQLAQSNQFQITSDAEIRQQFRRMNRPASDDDAVLAQRPVVAREVAMRRGAPLVVFATLTRLAGEYRLEIQLQRMGHDPDAAARTWSHSETASNKGEVLGALHAGADWVRALAGEQAQNLSSTDQPPEDITTGSWEALSYYTRAEQEHKARHILPAIALLREATATDPKFALAYAEIGDMEVEEQQYAMGYGAYRTALKLAGSDRRLSQREALRLAALVATDLDDFSGAKRASQAYTALYAHDSLGWFYQAYPDMQLGQEARAFQEWQRAQELAPQSPVPALWTAKADIYLERWGDAAAAISRGRALGDGLDAARLAGALAAAQRDFTTAARAQRILSNGPEATWRAQGDVLEAAVFAERGDLPAAKRVLRAGLVTAALVGPGTVGQYRLKLGDLDYRTSDLRAMVEDSMAAVKADPSPDVRSAAGALFARGGQLDLAEGQLRALQTEQDLAPLAAIGEERLRGEILLAQGHAAEALPWLQRAARASGTMADEEYLARGLAAVGQVRKAEQIYRGIAQHPGRIWWAFEDYPLGEIAAMSLQADKWGEQLHQPGSKKTRE
ncbi:MAG TPA: serine/threonine-protein kinase [Terriglobales bacterium]|nr:serine/threonine-protein kinase [Terriglobales bacterium]